MSFWNFKPIFKPVVHEWFFFAGLAVTAASMPNSVFMMSVGQFMVVGTWLFEGGYRDKLLRFWKNKAAVAFILIYLLHIVSLLWSENMTHVASNLRIKLPMLTLTFLVASSHNSFNAFKSHLLLILFAASVLVTSLIGFINFQLTDTSSFRQLSPFISHIRFGLMIVFSIFLIPWLHYHLSSQISIRFLKPPENLFFKILPWILSFWLVFFLVQMQTLSALAALIVVLIFLVFYFSIRMRARILAFSLAFILLLVLAAGSYTIIRFYKMVSSEVAGETDHLPVQTVYGNPYQHDLESHLRENGQLVYIMIADNELREEWGKNSHLDYEGKDLRGQYVRYTLYRYMTSLGLPKDREGFQKLSEEDINAVEEGTGNYLYNHWPGLLIRLHQTMWEIDHYRKGTVPEYHSVGLRLDYWSASWEAIKKHPLIGWGHGDIWAGLNYGYAQTQTLLPVEQRRRPHNEYLTFMIYFGLLGSVFVVGCIVFVIRRTGSWKILPNMVFMIILAVSMISEDTIENQAGLTFFVFFFLFFNFLYKAKD